jgi:hypothetical protein
MMKRLMCLGAVLMLAAAACISTAGDAGDSIPAGWVELDGRDLGVSLYIPPDWRFIRQDNDRILNLIADPDPPQLTLILVDKSNQSDYQMSDLDATGADLLDQYVQSFEKRLLRERNVNFEFGEYEVVNTRLDEPATMTDASGDAEYFIGTIPLGDEEVLVLIGFGDEDNHLDDDTRNLYRQIIGTIGEPGDE